MSMGQLSQPTIPYRRVASHADALALYNRIKPLRGSDPAGPRTLSRRSIHSKAWVRVEEGGEVVFKLYRTDIVTWWPDNTVTLEGHPTRSTAEMMNMLTPDTVRYQVNCKANSGLLHFGGGWQHRDKHFVAHFDYDVITLGETEQGVWMPDGWRASEKMELLRIDRKRAAEVCAEYGLPEFRKWFKRYLRWPQPDDGRRDMDAEQALRLIGQGKFVEAVGYLARCVRQSFGNDIYNWQTQSWDKPKLTMQSFEKLRQWVMSDAGCLDNWWVDYALYSDFQRTQSYRRKYGG